MVTPMRRKKQELSREACVEMLRRGTSGVLALAGGTGSDGFPYAVPLSYTYAEGAGGADARLIFHGANAGLKLDLIAADSRASFAVIDRDHVVPEEFTTYFRSVICFGTVRVVTDRMREYEDLMTLGLRFAPRAEEDCRKEIASSQGHTCVLELSIERMSGKEAIELVRQREQRGVARQDA